MNKTFDDFYYSVPNGIQELDRLEEANFLTKQRYLGNLFGKFLGSAKRKIKPDDYENTTPITKWGFSDLFGELTKRYNDPKKTNKKFYVKDLYQGKFNPHGKDSHPMFIDDDIEKLEVASFYKTNNGGTIILYQLKDTDGQDKFYVSTDGRAEKFFASEAKNGGLGMLFKAWLTNQKSNKNIFPDTGGGAVAGKPKMHIKVIDKATYDKLVPVESVQNEGVAGLASIPVAIPMATNSPVVEDELEEKYKKGDERPAVWSSIKLGFVGKSNKDELLTLGGGEYEVDENGEQTNKHKDILNWLIKNNPDQDFEGMDTAEIVKMIDGSQLSSQEKQELKDKAEETPPEKTEKPTEDKGEHEIDEKKMGELYNKLKNELETEPTKFGPTSNIETGWIYDLKGDNIIYAYKGKDGSYKISWKPTKGKARDLLVKLGYVDREDIKELK